MMTEVFLYFIFIRNHKLNLENRGLNNGTRHLGIVENDSKEQTKSEFHKGAYILVGN